MAAQQGSRWLCSDARQEVAAHVAVHDVELDAVDAGVLQALEMCADDATATSSSYSPAGNAARDMASGGVSWLLLSHGRLYWVADPGADSAGGEAARRRKGEGHTHSGCVGI